jgi:hypothetical protein
MYRVMRDNPCDTGDKEVLESIILHRVQQFLAWRRESESIDICLESLLQGGVAGESCLLVTGSRQ